MKHYSLALTTLLLSAVTHAALPQTPPDRLSDPLLNVQERTYG